MTTHPRATIRLQLHKEFDFAQALAQIPFFHRLGISHLYLSPIHTARTGSTHGYDVVDYGAVNPELGGEEGFRQLVAEARRYQMGVVVDLVPNHMAVGGHENRAWLDLLEWGRFSRYAGFFDVDWDVTDPALHHRVHLPFLGKPYGEVLSDGDLRLHFNHETGRFYAAYYEHHFPIAPKEYDRLLRNEAPELATLFKQFTGAGSKAGLNFEQSRTALREAIASDERTAELIERVLAQHDPSTDAGRNRLHRLLDRQHYRLAWWQTAADEINWRRFFDVIELAGLRVQDLTAFEVVHAKTLELYREGLIDGVRVDHVDGIADPRTYCRRLRRALARLNHARPESAPKGGPYIFVEKILAPGEELSKEWQVDGDTGYSFMNEVGALLHHPRGEEPLSNAWTNLTGRPADFEVEEHRARRRTVQTILAADFNACAHALHRIARGHPNTRDFTLAAIRRVLTELLVEFPVYRLYADARGRSPADQEIMRKTVEGARKRVQPSERPLLDKIDQWLGGEPPLKVKPAAARQARLRAIARFQQLSSPVAAKSVEDTAFYRHGPLLSRNEVGATPSQFYLTAAEFHGSMKRRRLRYPHAMLGTATHDHKRGEDVRARLAVLSELPQSWLEQVEAWRRQNLPLRENDQAGPDAADEYMLYQMLVGAWPLDCEGPKDIDSFCQRIAAWQEKAIREAKRNSSWTQPNMAYEDECREFLQALFSPGSGRLFMNQLHDFVQQIAAAGAVNGLTQVLLKMTAPGFPDFYQGCDLWDFSFVDPDNRRPVDYKVRHTFLADEFSQADVLENWRDGRIKQQVIAKTLSLRQQYPSVFSEGRYSTLKVEGPLKEHIVCFMREFEAQAVIVAAVRHAARLSHHEMPFIDPEVWQNTRLVMPTRLRQKSWRNVFSSDDGLKAESLFREGTVALLLGQD